MSTPLLIFVVVALLVVLVSAVGSLAPAHETDDLISAFRRPIPQVVLAYLCGLGSWLCLAGLLALIAREPEQACEASLPVSCLALPSWLTHFAWLLIAVPALSVAGAILAVRSYSRGDDAVRSLVALLVSLAPGALFGSLYVLAA